jgi:hypothetical protein
MKMRHAAVAPLLGIAGVLLLAACDTPAEETTTPVSSVDTWTRLSDHTAEFNDGTDQRYQVVFNRSGFTQIVTPSSAEYGRWVVDDQKGLCLQKDGSPQICAPLYQLSVSHYKWGETSFNLVDAGFRAGFPFYDRPHF